MNIHTIRNNETNFKANRVAIAKNINKFTQPSFEIFKLNINDKAYAKKYLANIKKYDLTGSQKDKIINFFNTFLSEQALRPNKSRHDFYIGIKGGKELVGGFTIEPDQKDVLLINNIFNTSFKDIFSKDFLFKFIIRKALKSPTKPIYGLSKKENSLLAGKDLIHREDLENKNDIINKKYPDIIYQTVHERTKNTDLIEYIG